MYHEPLTDDQWNGWFAAALLAPLAQSCGGNLQAALLSGIAAAAVMLVLSRRTRQWTRWTAAVMLAGLTVELWALLVGAENAWPSDRKTAVLPLTLLALAAASGLKGNGPAASAATVLLRFLAVGILIVTLCTMGKLQPRRILAETSSSWAAQITVWLLPLPLLLFPKPGKKQGGLWLLVLAGGILTAAANGVLGAAVGHSENRFYAMGRSAAMFGTVKHLEAAAGTALLLGWFASLSLALTAAGRAGEILTGNGCQWAAAVAAVSAATYLTGIRPGAATVLAAQAGMILAAAAAGKRNTKKDEKGVDK